MDVYLVWQNDALLGLYHEGAKAVERLTFIKGREPGATWTRSKAFDEKDPYVQRWWQTNGSVARLSVEKETVE